jgi:hypothetical protein
MIARNKYRPSLKTPVLISSFWTMPLSQRDQAKKPTKMTTHIVLRLKRLGRAGRSMVEPSMLVLSVFSMRLYDGLIEKFDHFRGDLLRWAIEEQTAFAYADDTFIMAKSEFNRMQAADQGFA